VSSTTTTASYVSTAAGTGVWLCAEPVSRLLPVSATDTDMLPTTAAGTAADFVATADANSECLSRWGDTGEHIVQPIMSIIHTMCATSWMLSTAATGHSTATTEHVSWRAAASVLVQCWLSIGHSMQPRQLLSHAGTRTAAAHLPNWRTSTADLCTGMSTGTKLLSRWLLHDAMSSGAGAHNVLWCWLAVSTATELLSANAVLLPTATADLSKRPDCHVHLCWWHAVCAWHGMCQRSVLPLTSMSYRHTTECPMSEQWPAVWSPVAMPERTLLPDAKLPQRTAGTGSVHDWTVSGWRRMHQQSDLLSASHVPDWWLRLWSMYDTWSTMWSKCTMPRRFVLPHAKLPKWPASAGSLFIRTVSSWC
jgi:hypothetical protein